METLSKESNVKYQIIVNPASRSCRGYRIWKQVIRPLLEKEGVDYTVYFSEEAGDIQRLTEQITGEAEPGVDVNLIFMGGDGTVNEVLQGIRDFSRVRIGYIPIGSSNDLARDLRLPQSPAKALERILHSGQECAYDIGTVTYPDGVQRHFAVSCGIGFDAAVCQEAMHSGIKDILNKIRLGKLTYLGIALKQLFSAQKVFCTLLLPEHEPIAIDRLLFLTGMVHRFEGGGFRFCPDADATDGKLNLCVVGDIPKFLAFAALPTAFWGKHYMVKGITPYTADSYKIKTSIPLWVHTDGEVYRKADCFQVNCTRGALRMIV